MFGSERLAVLLVNSGGHAQRSVEMADDCIERYSMEAFPRVRLDGAEFNAQVAATFGQYGYGKVLIDDAGILRGLGVRDAQFQAALPAATSTPLAQLEGFEIDVRVSDITDGRPGMFNTDCRLTQDVMATVTVALNLPEGWHVYGPAGPTPTSLAIDYSGTAAPSAARFEGHGPGHGPDEWTQKVELSFRTLIRKGTAIGRHFLHGRLSFTACNAEGCLPPLELPWTAIVDAM